MKVDTDKQKIRSILKENFSGREEVIFLDLFGSFVNEDTYRDIDIGTYTNNEFELIQLGEMYTEISELIKCDFDLVHLNKILRKRPVLAHQIVSKGELLFNRDPEIHTKYKKEVLLFYFDTAYLRDKIDGAFEKRLKANKFGIRNYEYANITPPRGMELNSTGPAPPSR